MKMNAARCCTRRARWLDLRWCVFRAARPGVPIVEEMTACAGRAQLRAKPQRPVILAFGALVDSAQKIAEHLDATLVNMRFVKPLDETS